MAGAVMKRTPYNRLIRFQLREENVIGSGIEKMLLSHPEDICSADEIALSHKLDSCLRLCPIRRDLPLAEYIFSHILHVQV